MITYRRRRPRRRGCLSSAMILSLIFGGLMLSWGWLADQLRGPNTPPPDGLSDAESAFTSGDLDGAIVTAREVYDAEPERFDALLLLVRSLIYRSYSDYNHSLDRQVALQLADRAVQAYPTVPDVLAARALALHANGRAVDGFRMAERALTIDPEHTMARIALALTYGGVGGYNAALREAETVIASAPLPLHYDALRTYAVALGDLGRYADALTVSERAVKLNPRVPLANYERALFALQLGDFNTATTAYFHVLSHDPDNAKAHLRLCELSTVLRETDNAERYCLKTTEIAPGWADGWYRLGREHYLQGDFQAAQTYLNRCTRLQIAQNVPVPQRQFECWYLQGLAAEANGDCPALNKVYNEYITMTDGYDLPQTWTLPPEGPVVCTS